MLDNYHHQNALPTAHHPQSIPYNHVGLSTVECLLNILHCLNVKDIDNIST